MSATRRSEHAGLQDLFSYPLTSAIQDRRTRRVAQGVSLKHGAQPYESANAPSPLSPLEEAILIASTSVTGAVMHDGPTEKVDGSPELGTMFLEVAGRAALQRRQRAGDVVLHDQRRGRVADRAPARRQPRSSSSRRSRRAGRTARRTTGCRSPTRSSARSTTAAVSFPDKQWPYFLGWNGQMSNAPGTTQFLPVVDNTRQYINVLLILLERAARQGAAVRRRLAAVPAV